MDVLFSAYSIQFLSESQKNFDADMTNPNYDAKDHVYDEIKHKDGYKDLGKLLTNIWNLISSYTLQFHPMHALRYDT